MPWPVPSAKTLAERIAAALEQGLAALRPDIDPLAISRAVRSARGVLSMIGRAVALETREVHDHLAWWGRQYFVDSAEDEFVARHADIWGVTPRPATHAIGTVTIDGIAGATLPAGLELSAADGRQFVTEASATIPPGGTVSVRAKATLAGLAGNIEAGIRLKTVTAFPDINRITVANDGLAGGAEAETPAELAAATIAHIRQRPHGGAGFDYPTWLRERFDVSAVKVHTDWIGRGSVGVVVAINDGATVRAPTADEQADMLAFLGAPGSASGVRPVTAHIVIVPAVIRPIPLVIRLRPDTIATRAAVAEAWRAFLVTVGDDNDALNDSRIGAVLEPSRISEALSAASGEYAHDIVEPALRLALQPNEFPVAGPITFKDPT